MPDLFTRADHDPENDPENDLVVAILTTGMPVIDATCRRWFV